MLLQLNSVSKGPGSPYPPTPPSSVDGASWSQGSCLGSRDHIFVREYCQQEGRWSWERKRQKALFSHAYLFRRKNFPHRFPVDFSSPHVGWNWVIWSLAKKKEVHEWFRPIMFVTWGWACKHLSTNVKEYWADYQPHVSSSCAIQAVPGTEMGTAGM